MNRTGGLQSSRQWLEGQAGRTPVQMAKSYRTWFGVDWPCAIKELETLGIHLDPEWVAGVYRSLEGSLRACGDRAGRREGETAKYDAGSDEYFAYIAGCTSGGAPFGITWERWRQLEAEERLSQDPEYPF